uniref:MARVEL domain-containing protein n=1 Tax=Heterorhabditis bacteriophora TaxID=37862 RepID=A0A1I7XAR6_HETBA
MSAFVHCYTVYFHLFTMILHALFEYICPQIPHRFHKSNRVCMPNMIHFLIFLQLLWHYSYYSAFRKPLSMAVKADLAITALFFILFFFCSATWWAGANTIGKATEKEHLTVILKEKFNATYISNQTHNGKLVISVLSDWVCVFTFAFNCWFIWKEVVPKQSMDPTQIA